MSDYTCTHRPPHFSCWENSYPFHLCVLCCVRQNFDIDNRNKLKKEEHNYACYLRSSQFAAHFKQAFESKDAAVEHEHHILSFEPPRVYATANEVHHQDSRKIDFNRVDICLSEDSS